ncbi:MAG: LysE family transporter [Chitinophagaceae bacterium]|jgi:threonine/homoserine/homoserine lactone efflux protein|nr:LysE family transporter [Chitinophagaceae bacterium]MBK7678043.1 LysE family transporter [Chitinophagaceae bacterium]MBK8301361.1 LysE family transporter [Chitinophagaceae bacterium]MBK9466119.1 LysE family transporter [Chitinophagaceae bacterium]MBK9658311.1 LysE family transporter [Chitinophagaceae bacterium]
MLEAMLKGLGFGLLLSISVGPVLFSIIKQSLNNGHRGGFAFIFGVSASDITLVLVSNVFTELFNSLKEYKTEVGVAGCIFLVSMGIYFLFFKKVKVNEQGKQEFKFRKRDYAKIFFSGYFMNTLNPAVFIFWITTSTAVIVHSINDRIIIFITCLVWMLGTDILKVLLAGKIRNRLTPHNIHIINRINGIILIVFGFALIWGLLAYGKRL